MNRISQTMMMFLPAAAMAASVLFVGPVMAQGNLLDQGRNLLGGGKSGSSSSNSNLTNQQADSGLREALRVATQRTVSRVGKQDGYLKDPAIKIPLPGYLAGARDMMAKAGMSGMLDDLELRMNRAAEAAAPKAADIFGKAISSMSVTDAKGIITGPNDAATQYFKRTTTKPLTDAFRPIMEQQLSQAGATQAFHKVSQSASSSASGAAGGLGGLAGLAGGGSGAPQNFNFSDYAVGKALDGLFHYVGTEEAAIRTNPAARSTDLLKQVFGH
jgi:hypothetical protein